MCIDTARVGIQIQKARRLKKWSVADLAAAVHYTPKSIVYAENGQVEFSLELLLSLCDALEVTPNDLLEGQFRAVSRALEEQALLAELKELTDAARAENGDPPSSSTRIKDTETARAEIRQAVINERSKLNAEAQTKRKLVHW